MRYWHGSSLERGANSLHMVQLIPLPLPSLAPVKSRIVYFWCWLTQVVLGKRPLNGCISSSNERIRSCGSSLENQVLYPFWFFSVCETTKDIWATLVLFCILLKLHGNMKIAMTFKPQCLEARRHLETLLPHAVNCARFCFWLCMWRFCLCVKYLWNCWTALHQIHRENVFGPSLGRVWMSRPPRTKNGILGRYLRSRWTDLQHIHTEDIFGPLLGWSSKPGTKNVVFSGYLGKRSTDLHHIIMAALCNRWALYFCPVVSFFFFFFYLLLLLLSSSSFLFLA